MSHDLHLVDKAVQDVNIWVKELDHKMGWADKKRTLRLLRTILHALRDRLTVVEAAHLGAQLPTLIRGLYYEEWRPAITPVHEYSEAEFLSHLEKAFTTDPIRHPEEAAKAVFDLLEDHVSAGEIEDVKKVLPPKIRALWTTH